MTVRMYRVHNQVPDGVDVVRITPDLSKVNVPGPGNVALLHCIYVWFCKICAKMILGIAEPSSYTTHSVLWVTGIFTPISSMMALKEVKRKRMSASNNRPMVPMRKQSACVSLPG